MLHISSLFPVRRHAIMHGLAAGLAVESRLRLCCASVVVLLLSLGIAHAQPDANGHTAAVAMTDPFAGFVAEASHRFALPVSSIRAVMQAESGGDVRALSPKGAMGLMQIMPATWAELRQRYGLGADPYDPRDNITAGTAYLRELHDRFGERGFLAAYNAGPSRYEEHLATGRPLPAETLSYMATVKSMLDGTLVKGSPSAASWASSSLFVAIAGADLAPSQPSSKQASQHRSTNVLPSTTAPLTPLSDGLFARTSDWGTRP
ncbi:lytic transglycosylase domain-containing protein [Reyranella sp.]|uniref:lytic transglycosylase domain-containing protein n=1 Tax=Reyranella sp. TaxID=1929291 RepID=UPI0025F7AEE8|nr:lytic transglycosylase domain-containing protein [Reyranella sp.]